MEDQLSETFRALADPTRRAILARLASGEASVTELAEPFAMSQPAISKHLKVLERAGLISRGRDRQRRPCRLEAQALAAANEWLGRWGCAPRGRRRRARPGPRGPPAAGGGERVAGALSRVLGAELRKTRF